jgi:hypothetical protein
MTQNNEEMYHSVRGKHGIGKVLGRNKWIHISALDALPANEQQLVLKALIFLPTPLSADKDIIVRLNLKKNSVMFSESPDWNLATEPVQGKYFVISDLNKPNPKTFPKNTPVTPLKDPRIYHHKWMFVKDDFPGFDVKESMKWSETWENSDVVKELLKDKSNNFRVRIGGQKYWQEKVLSKLG